MGRNVLVVDDDPGIRSILMEMLDSLGHQPVCAGNGEEALKAVANALPDTILLDLNLPTMDGLQVLRKLHEVCSEARIILISGSMAIEDAVDAMKYGALDCLPKPISLRDLELALARGEEALESAETHDPLPNCPMLAFSPAMQDLRATIKRVARTPAATVLVVGETGTGKEVAARHLHAYSERADKPFVAVNCAAIPAALIESELFGHERGAFTDAKGNKSGLFEEADGGTLFLDEIGELPLPLQAKLLRVLQERVVRRVGGTKDIPINVRIVAATNVNLLVAVANQEFREDLYFRLNVITICLPALCERTEDIVPMAEAFAARMCKDMGKPQRSFSEEERHALRSYAWPGNVRELRNCIERCVLLDQARLNPAVGVPARKSERLRQLVAESFEAPILPRPAAAAFSTPPAHPGQPNEVVLSLPDPSLANAERQLIMEVLERVHGNRNQAATMLGINRTTLYRKLVNFGVAEPAEAELA